MREQTFAVLLALAAALVITGVAHFSDGAAFITGGVLVALWAWLVLGEVDDG